MLDFFLCYQEIKMATTALFNVGPYGKINKERTNMTEPKLYMYGPLKQYLFKKLDIYMDNTTG